MSAAATLDALRERGYRAALDGKAQELVVTGPGPVPTDLRAEIVADTVSIKAAVLLDKPPEWLKLMLDRYVSGHVYVAARGQSFRVSLVNVCANVAAAIGLSPLEWKRIRPEVEECTRRWKPPKKMEVLAYA